MSKPTTPLARAVRSLCDDAAKGIAKAVIDSGATEKYKNPDGTYDGIGLLADLGGVSRDEVRQIWEELKRQRAQ